MLIEVGDKDDVKIIKEARLDRVGLSVNEPRKLDPCVVIYDVEKDWKVEELKEDLVSKNFRGLSESEVNEIKEDLVFRHAFKSKNENRVNWIVQLPCKGFHKLRENGRAFMMWRAYRVKEYINIARCYKCHVYGHIAKHCGEPKQLCETCGSTEHTREACKDKDSPKCPICIKHKRKDVEHSLRSKNCPEYIRQVELYKNKIKWS